MWARLHVVARVILPIVFIVLGIGQLTNIAGIAAQLARVELPVPIPPEIAGISTFTALAYLGALVQVGCGLMVLLGYKTRWAASALLAFTAATIVVTHHFWDMQGLARAENLAQALKNLAIMAGILMVAAHGAGHFSLDSRKR